MKSIFTLFALTLGFLSLSLNKIGAEEPLIDAQKWKNLDKNIELLSMHIEAKKERVEDLRSDIFKLDERIENRVSHVIDMVKEYKDSPESRESLARTKLEVVEELKESIRYYSEQKNFFKKERINPSTPLSIEKLTEGVSILEERIDRRIAQIVEVSHSFDVEKNIPKKERFFDDDELRFQERNNKEYKRNKRQKHYQKRNINELSDEFEKAIERLKRENIALKRKLSSEMSKEVKSLIELTIEENNALIVKREKQLRTLNSDPSIMAEAVNRKQAKTIDSMIMDINSELNHDFVRLRALIKTFVHDSAALHNLEKRLASWEAIRQEHQK